MVKASLVIDPLRKSHSDVGSKSLREVRDLGKKEVLHYPPLQFVKHPGSFSAIQRLSVRMPVSGTQPILDVALEGR